MKKFRIIFVRGLVVTLPIILTVSLISWLINKIDQFIDPIVVKLFAEQIHFPGLGLMVVFMFIMTMGMLAENYFTSTIVAFFSRSLEKIPFIKIIYGPLKDFFSLLSGEHGHKSMQRVVMLEVRPSIWMIGFVTRHKFQDLNLPEWEEDELMAVYVPSSYMIGGNTLIVQKKLLKEINISVDKALKLAITGWIHIEEDHIK